MEHKLVKTGAVSIVWEDRERGKYRLVDGTFDYWEKNLPLRMRLSGWWDELAERRCWVFRWGRPGDNLYFHFSSQALGFHIFTRWFLFEAGIDWGWKYVNISILHPINENFKVWGIRRRFS